MEEKEIKGCNDSADGMQAAHKTICEYERPDITEIHRLESERCIFSASADGPFGSDNSEEGSDYWSPFGLEKGIPD